MIVKIENLEGKLKFPVARRSRKTGCVVVFSNKHTGMVVDGPISEVGQYDTDWRYCESEEIWEPVELTITG